METISKKNSITKPSDEDNIVSNILDANRYSEQAYWSMKNIDLEKTQRFDIENKIKDVLSLLQKVDNITIDIAISISSSL